MSCIHLSNLSHASELILSPCIHRLSGPLYQFPTVFMFEISMYALIIPRKRSLPPSTSRKEIKYTRSQETYFRTAFISLISCIVSIFLLILSSQTIPIILSEKNQRTGEWKQSDFPQKHDYITVCPLHKLFEMNPSPHTLKFPQFYYNPLPCEIPINCISQKQRIFYQILMRRTALLQHLLHMLVVLARLPPSLSSSRECSHVRRGPSLSLSLVCHCHRRLPPPVAHTAR